jgi:hypothetical protein
MNSTSEGVSRQKEKYYLRAPFQLEYDFVTTTNYLKKSVF